MVAGPAQGASEQLSSEPWEGAHRGECRVKHVPGRRTVDAEVLVDWRRTEGHRVGWGPVGGARWRGLGLDSE